MKKNGFVATSLIYTFFVIFLLLMLFLLTSYTRMRNLLDEFKYDIKNNFAEYDLADINIFILIRNPLNNEYDYTDDMPTFGYVFNTNYSYCKNGSSISYTGSGLMVTAPEKDTCYAYFDLEESDITLHLYKESTTGSYAYNNMSYIETSSQPDDSYEFSTYVCTDNNATIKENNGKLVISATGKDECNVYYNIK